MRIGMIVICTALLAMSSNAEDWKTYQSSKFGYAISYPPEMEYKPYLDRETGAEISGAVLKDGKTGFGLVDFDIWPGSECPRQSANTAAKDLGLERAKVVTQADGPDGSSSCGDPVTVREFAAKSGAKIYELELTCRSESYPGGHDDTVEEPTPVPGAPEPTPVVRMEGEKGPTFFVDISLPWRQQILMADPAGVDPRSGQAKQKIDPALVRKILASVKTFPIQQPPRVVCIEDFRNRGIMMGVPVPAGKP